MTAFKKKISAVATGRISPGVRKSKERRSKPWLKYYSAPIARMILSRLEEKELSQVKLAAELKVTPQQISKIIKGEENLTLETIYKLSKALNFDLITFPDYKYGKRNKVIATPPVNLNIDPNSHFSSGTKS